MRNITKFDAEVITDLHPLFRCLQWVAQARAKDDERYILQHIHVEREGLDYHVVATDGKRLHVGTFDPGMFDDDIHEIEPGNYELVAKSSKRIVLAINDEAGNYPRWQNLMPEDLPVMRDVVTRASIGRLGIRSGVLLATDFVLEACGFGAGFGKDESVAVEFASSRPGGPFVIRHELGRAIVMPMKLDDEMVSEEAATAPLHGLVPEEKPAEPDADPDAPELALEGPVIVDVEEVAQEEDDEPASTFLADVEKAAKALCGKGTKAHKEAQFDLIHDTYKLPGMRKLREQCGDRIKGLIFERWIDDAIYAFEEAAAEDAASVETQLEGDDDY